MKVFLRNNLILIFLPKENSLPGLVNVHPALGLTTSPVVDLLFSIVLHKLPEFLVNCARFSDKFVQLSMSDQCYLS